MQPSSSASQTEMTRPTLAVTDLAAATEPPQRSVKARIERRLVVLRDWLKNGIPPEKTVPRSLTAARHWSDPELGIERICSPNEFTTTHPQHHQLIVDVAALLTKLEKRYSKSGKATQLRQTAPSGRFDEQAFERQLTAVTSQWHSERAQRLQERVQADSAVARSVVLLEENAQMEKLIADLRRQLAAGKGLRAVK